MNLIELKQALSAAGDRELSFHFPDGSELAAHFHVTEVGKVTKDFVDCGGQRRATVACVLQTLVADDVDHRLRADKLAKILELASPLGMSDDLTVEVEVQDKTISVYSLGRQGEASIGGDKNLPFALVPKNTACLAPDRCGIGVLPVVDAAGDCSGETGCC